MRAEDKSTAGMNEWGASGVVLKALAELSWILNEDQQMLGSALMSVPGPF